MSVHLMAYFWLSILATNYVYEEEKSAGAGHFMAYFLTAVVLCVAGYVIFHNKQKVRV